jgi:hypothetical protein
LLKTGIENLFLPNFAFDKVERSLSHFNNARFSVPEAAVSVNLPNLC